MKLAKLGLVVAAFALALCLRPTVGWSTRAYDLISGEITAAPVGGEIEVAHHLYHIKPNSAADKASSSLYTGQIVDLVFDGPVGSKASAVVSIKPHTGS